MLFTDTVSVAGTRRTADGYLVADARVARTGVQVYSGAEAGKPELPLVRMFRPAEEIFDKDSLASFAHKPVTDGHPAGPVTAQNWSRLAKGHIGDRVARDGEFVQVPMMVADAATIADIEAGRAELSAGYVCVVDWTAGQTDAGEAYDAVQRRIRINHVARVDHGRAGPQCRIGDSWAAFDAGAAKPSGGADAPHTPPANGNSAPMKTHLIDGHTVEMSDAAVVAVSALQRRAAELTADNLKLVADAASAATAHAKALETKDGETAALKAEHVKALETKDGALAAKDAAHATALQAKDGEIAALKAQIPDAAKLDALAAARVDLITKAKNVLGDGFEPAGKSDAEIRKAVVEKALGDGAKAMSDAAIEGAFAVVAASKGAIDPIRTAMGDSSRTASGDDKAKAFADMRADLENRWTQAPAV